MRSIIRDIKKLLFLMLIMGLVCLVGCGRRSKRDVDFGDLKGKLEEQTQKTQSAEEEEPAPEKKEKKPKKEERQEEEKEEEEEGDFAEEFKNGEVENNGGLFVRIGNRVYFRIFGKRGLELITIGSPRIEEADPSVESRLMYYDLDTGETGEVCKVRGLNGLLATVDGFCLASPDLEETVLIRKDGSVDKHYLEGYPICASEDGRSLTVYDVNDNGAQVPVMYHDGRKVGSPEEGSGESVYYSALDFSGSDLIGLMSYSYNDENDIYSYDENGMLTVLGRIERLDMETYSLSPEIEEIIPTDEGGYITVGYHDGTAHSLVEWSLYEFTSGRRNSVKLIESGGETEKYGYSLPHVIPGRDGKPQLSVHKAGEVFLSEGSYGDLMYHTKHGEDIVAQKNYIYKPEEWETYASAIQGAVYLNGDAIFLANIKGEREPGEDIGWRWAYKLGSIDYQGIRLGDSKDIKGCYETVASVGWNQGEIEYDRLIGTWEAYSVNVEGEYHLASDEAESFREMITFYEDGSAVIWHKDQGTGKKNNERPIHQVAPEEYGADYAYNYETEDEDPMKIGICYLEHNRLCTYSLYHFDGGSTGWYETVYVRPQD